jgi:hypothetical protein
MTSLKVTVHSYHGMLYFGLTSARRIIPHLGDPHLPLEEAVADLKPAAARPDAN